MNPRILVVPVLALLAIFALIGENTVTVSAQTVATTGQSDSAQSSETKAVVTQGEHSYRGPRYRQRRYGYNFYYDGWYYPYGWWYETGKVEAPVEVRMIESEVDQHVKWCEEKFRSYNPATDQYLAYSGKHRPCKSPYRD